MRSQAFQIMIRRNARELKTRLQRPDRIDALQRHIAPMRFIEGFQRINACPLELRPHQAIKQLDTKRLNFSARIIPL